MCDWNQLNAAALCCSLQSEFTTIRILTERECCCNASAIVSVILPPVLYEPAYMIHSDIGEPECFRLGQPAVADLIYNAEEAVPFFLVG